MSAAKQNLEQASIRQHCKQLRLPTMGAQFVNLAEQAIKEKQGHVSYLDALLTVEIEEREKNAVARRMQEAHFPNGRRCFPMCGCARRCWTGAYSDRV